MRNSQRPLPNGNGTPVAHERHRVAVLDYTHHVLSYVTTIHFESARLSFHVMWLHALSWHESFTTHVMYYCDDVLGTALLFCVDFINGL